MSTQDAAKTALKHERDVKDCTVKHVTVYLDRAEVLRTIKKLKLQPGANEVRLTKLSSAIDKESIRVEGRGEATIVDVTYQEQHVKQKEGESEKLKELREKKDKLENEQEEARRHQERLQEQRSVIRSISTKLAGPGICEPSEKDELENEHEEATRHKERWKEQRSVMRSISTKPPGGVSFAVISDATIEGIKKYFLLYGKDAAKDAGDLDAQLMHVASRLKILDEEIRIVQTQMSRAGHSDSESILREVSIFLDSQKGGEVDLDVSYVVFRSSWSPTYDIRVFTDESVMKVTYFGLIKQSTGEDWLETKISLSTAMPSVGGTIPELGTKKVSFVRREPPMPHYQPMMMARMGGGGGAGMMAKEAFIMDEAQAAPMAFSMPLAEVRESTISTSFEIARNASVPSDDTEHKVSIAIVDLKPEFSYETVPAKSAFAFLKAKVKNTSPYAFLPGPTSIFLDNNFVAKSSIKAVSPAEEFTCSLGVDPAVRITYKAPRKFQEESGILTKSTHVTTEQLTEVKNTHTKPIKILVVDHLPLSTDEKIKVSVVEPVLPKTEKDAKSSVVKLNKLNNVEWEIELPASETRELRLKYSIEYPRAEVLDFAEERA